MATVAWKKAGSADALVAAENSYQMAPGGVEANTQTATLTIPGTLNTEDAAFTCEIASAEHGKTAQAPEATTVQSKVFDRK